MRLFGTLLIIIGVCAAPAAQTRRPPAKPAPAAQAAPKKPPAVKKEQAVPFGQGETLTFDIGWSSYLTAGTATIAVQQKRPSYGATAYYIVAEGRPTPLRVRRAAA